MPLEYMDSSNKEKTLADALSKIETLAAENTKFGADLENANTRVSELEAELSSEKSAHASAKESLATLEGKHRDIDKEVSLKVAEIAAQSGVEPIKNVSDKHDDESLEELAKRIDAAQGVEKAKLVEAHYDKIMGALRKVRQ